MWSQINWKHFAVCVFLNIKIRNNICIFMVFAWSIYLYLYYTYACQVTTHKNGKNVCCITVDTVNL